MLGATKAVGRKEYVVKYGYVYSDPHGNHYKPGDVVSLTAKEYDLAKHRVTPFVQKDQVRFESQDRPPAGIYGRSLQAPIEPVQPDPSSKKKEDQEDLAPLSGILGRGEYEVK